MRHFFNPMVTITIQITHRDNETVNLQIEGHGKTAEHSEVKVAQKILDVVRQFTEPALVEVITPRIETIVRSEDAPQDN